MHNDPIKKVFGSKNQFKLNWKNLTVSQVHLPGFLIQASNDSDCFNDKQLIELKTNCLHVVIQLTRLLGVQFYIVYISTVVFALISYSNFFIPIMVIASRFLIISIPLVAILINYQNVPEFTVYTFIDYWFLFFFFYIMSMFGFLFVALKEFSDEILFGPNQYIQALMNKDQTEQPNREMAFSNWKQHLKEQTEQQHSNLVSVSDLKADQIARCVYPTVLAAFLLIYTLFVFINT